MADKISLLITDDHALVRQGIQAFLELQPDLTVIGEADSGEAAVRMAAELAPDVVLMDLVMPGIGGGKTVGFASGGVAGPNNIQPCRVAGQIASGAIGRVIGATDVGHHHHL